MKNLPHRHCFHNSLPCPFNDAADDIARETLRSNPPDWRVIDGGRSGAPRDALTTAEYEQRQKQILTIRRFYSLDAAARLERQLVEDVRRLGRRQFSCPVRNSGNGGSK